MTQSGLSSLVGARLALGSAAPWLCLAVLGSSCASKAGDSGQDGHQGDSAADSGTLDTGQDDSDTGEKCAPTATLVIRNDTPEDLGWIYVCTPDDCVYYLLGIGLGTGESDGSQLCPGEYISEVVDVNDRCAVSDWFTLGEDGEYDWIVSEMTGSTSGGSGFGCEVDPG